VQTTNIFDNINYFSWQQHIDRIKENRFPKMKYILPERKRHGYTWEEIELSFQLLSLGMCCEVLNSCGGRESFVCDVNELNCVVTFQKKKSMSKRAKRRSISF
jgi:hypothetical protein